MNLSLRSANRSVLDSVTSKRSLKMSSVDSHRRNKKFKWNYNLRKRNSNGTVCLKSSFDRIDDDLSELIFSFLPLKDKFRFECLSKHVQRVIFNRERSFSVTLYKRLSYSIFLSDSYNLLSANKDYSEYKVKYNSLKTILQKLKSLTALEVSDVIVSAQLFRIVANNCPHLQHFIVNGIASKFKVNKTNAQSISYFGRKCGHKLLSLKMSKTFPEQFIEQLHSFTPNLTSSHKFGDTCAQRAPKEWKSDKHCVKIETNIPKPYLILILNTNSNLFVTIFGNRSCETHHLKKIPQ